MKLNRLAEYRMSDGASLNPKRDNEIQHKRQSVAPTIEPKPIDPSHNSDKINRRYFDVMVQQVVDSVIQNTGLRISKLGPNDKGKYVIASSKGPIIGQVRFHEIDGEIVMQIEEELEATLRMMFKRTAKKLGMQPFRDS